MVVEFYILSLDDLCLCRTGLTKFSNFVMFWDFKIKGYPAFETFNEVMTFQLLLNLNHLFYTTRIESRDL